MPSYSDTVEDLNLKFGNSFLRYDGQIIYLSEVETDEDDLYWNVLIGESHQRASWRDKDPELLEMIQCDSQFFNHPKLNDLNWRKSYVSGCYYYSRTGHRQNKRSLSYENSQLFQPWIKILALVSGGSFDQCNITIPLVASLLSEKYPEYQEALRLCHSCGMVAISPQFAVSLSHISKEKFLLSSTFGFIGEATSTHLYIYHKGSRQEIYDWVRRQHLDLEIVDA